jgi:drug/metabolite transporter (DMT)-like permease
MQRRSQHEGVALMTAGGLLLGTLGWFLERAGQPALTAVWFRCIFGGLALAAFAAAAGRLGETRLARRAWGPVLGAGVAMATSWLLFFAALQRVPIGVATVVVHVEPVLLVLLAAAWRREPVPAAALAGAVLALGGLVLAAGGAGHVDAAGVVLCLGAALAWALATLLVQAAAASALALAGWQCVVGALLTTPFVAASGTWPPLAAWGWLAALGIVHTGFAYVLLYAGVARLPAPQVAALQWVYPLTAIGVDALAFDRTLGAEQWLGVVLIGAALVLGARPQRGAVTSRPPGSRGAPAFSSGAAPASGSGSSAPTG